MAWSPALPRSLLRRSAFAPHRCNPQAGLGPTAPGSRAQPDSCAAHSALAAPIYKLRRSKLEFEWESEIDRGSRDYIKWVQRSLNSCLVEPCGGRHQRNDERSAVRSFKHATAPVDGIVGPQTEAA